MAPWTVLLPLPLPESYFSPPLLLVAVPSPPVAAKRPTLSERRSLGEIRKILAIGVWGEALAANNFWSI